MNDPVTEDFGRNCLVARRLLERGVRFVQVWSGADNGFPRRNWDSHEDIARDHATMGRSMDRPAAALLNDLKDRGLLEDTIVMWTTEFGRMPCSQGTKGRDHNPFTFTSWLAGGGIPRRHDLRRQRRVVVQSGRESNLLLRHSRHDAAPAGHRSHEADVPSQRHRSPFDRRPWARDQRADGRSGPSRLRSRVRPQTHRFSMSGSRASRPDDAAAEAAAKHAYSPLAKKHGTRERRTLPHRPDATRPLDVSHQITRRCRCRTRRGCIPSASCAACCD